MDHTYAIGKKTFHISGTTTSPSPMKKIVSDLMLNDARYIVAKLNSKISSESIKEEKMSTPQEPVQQEKLHSYKETIFDKAQPSKENDSLMNTNNGALNKEDDESYMSEEKLLTEIQEEKRTLEELKMDIDKHLPFSLNMANIPESSKEDKDYYGEDFGKDEDYYLPPSSLPSNLQPQAYKTLKEKIRSAKNNIRKFLYQLYEAIELTYQSMKDSEDQKNCHKALFELWIEWSKSQSENADDNTQLLETRTLGMSSNIALKLHSAFMDLMPKIQGLPNNLQDKLQQACFDMQDLHATFALSTGFHDLDKNHLTQSQFKLTQAQRNIEELFCFLEDGMPSGWIIGPISPSEYPLLEGVTLSKEKES